MHKAHLLLLAAVVGGTAAVAGGVWAAGDLPTKFANRNSIAETRHNLTQRPSLSGPGGTLAGGTMDSYRNNFGEVCVYCHTPHGSNTQTSAPLWNRTINTGTYTVYNSTTLTQVATQPGQNSITCLSCHDGTIAVDSIINMPGSGRYNKDMETSSTASAAARSAFLDTWPGAVQGGHDTLSSAGCLACHSTTAGPVGRTATDFTVFEIGTDLRNDHPIGVSYPIQNPAANDFNATNGQNAAVAWFDRNGNTRPDTNEIRLYNTGAGYEVECASCHDPHGVPSAGPGSQFNPSFLRVSNNASGVCLTCHNK